jgi:hypothetical protein
MLPETFSNRERQGIHEVSYEVDAAYPASPFVCELTQHLDQRQWRGLRQDALNAGSESSLVRGRGDYGNATRKPETHVHSWSAPKSFEYSLTYLEHCFGLSSATITKLEMRRYRGDVRVD